MITDEQAERANDFIRDQADNFAAAKSNRRYLEEFRKSKKAILFSESGEKTDKGKENYAYAHPEYEELLTALKDAIQDEESLRWKMVAAQAKIEMWRTYQANNRKGI